MTLHFSKYQGTGNDFIMVDCTNSEDFKLSSPQINHLCDRRFGIGADGIILIYQHPQLDFKMDYYNSDGSQSFCGNGARCATQFAYSLGLFNKAASFEAIDGVHTASINQGLISLKMKDVKDVKMDGEAYVIDTGSPHYILFSKNLNQNDIVSFGKKIRYSSKYEKEGINVNLVEVLKRNQLKMLTYERGVEDETFSCGTGATAVALAYAEKISEKHIHVDISVKGGQLTVKAEKKSSGFASIHLIGPAERTFDGEILI